jgi:hypothetical protein
LCPRIKRVFRKHFPHTLNIRNEGHVPRHSFNGNIVTLMLFVIFKNDTVVREKGALDVGYKYCIKIDLHKCYLFRSRVAEDMVRRIYGSMEE